MQAKAGARILGNANGVGVKDNLAAAAAMVAAAKVGAVKPADADANEGPDAYPPPARVSWATSA